MLYLFILRNIPKYNLTGTTQITFDAIKIIAIIPAFFKVIEKLRILTYEKMQLY